MYEITVNGLNDDLELCFILSLNVNFSALIDYLVLYPSSRALFLRCVLFIQLCNNPPYYWSIGRCWLEKWSRDGKLFCGELNRLVLYCHNPSWLYTGCMGVENRDLLIV